MNKLCMKRKQTNKDLLFSECFLSLRNPSSHHELRKLTDASICEKSRLTNEYTKLCKFHIFHLF